MKELNDRPGKVRPEKVTAEDWDTLHSKPPIVAMCNVARICRIATHGKEPPGEQI